jgi:hypothetical protein
MAKRIVKWTLDNTILKVSKYTDNKEAAVIIEAEFNLNELAEAIANPENKDFTMQALTYLAKQKLMDSGANDIGSFDGKIISAKEKWTELVAGKWTGERTNATGKAEDKKAIATVKEITKVVSLEGLTVKKVLYPNTFTEQDQIDLDRLMAAAVEITKGQFVSLNDKNA